MNGTETKPTKKTKLAPRAERRKAHFSMPKANRPAWIGERAETIGTNRHTRRSDATAGLLAFCKGEWVKPLAIAIRGMLRRAGRPVTKAVAT